MRLFEGSKNSVLYAIESRKIAKKKKKVEEIRRWQYILYTIFSDQSRVGGICKNKRNK